jgi:hypothetical protein
MTLARTARGAFISVSLKSRASSKPVSLSSYSFFERTLQRGPQASRLPTPQLTLVRFELSPDDANG